MHLAVMVRLFLSFIALRLFKTLRLFTRGITQYTVSANIRPQFFSIGGGVDLIK